MYICTYKLAITNSVSTCCKLQHLNDLDFSWILDFGALGPNKLKSTFKFEHFEAMHTLEIFNTFWIFKSYTIIPKMRKLVVQLGKSGI